MLNRMTSCDLRQTSKLSQLLIANVNFDSGWYLQVGCTGDNLEVPSVPFLSVIISMSHFALKIETVKIF
jgi:hypothetical protein